MLQKIIQVGNSAAVTIPKSLMEEINLRVGDQLEVEGDHQLEMLIIKKKNSPYKSKITPEFKDWLDKFIKKNASLLAELARR